MGLHLVPEHEPRPEEMIDGISPDFYLDALFAVVQRRSDNDKLFMHSIVECIISEDSFLPGKTTFGLLESKFPGASQAVHEEALGLQEQANSEYWSSPTF